MSKGITKGTHQIESSCIHSSKPKSEHENSGTKERTTSHRFPLHQHSADFFHCFSTSVLLGRFHKESMYFEGNWGKHVGGNTYYILKPQWKNGKTGRLLGRAQETRISLRRYISFGLIKFICCKRMWLFSVWKCLSPITVNLWMSSVLSQTGGPGDLLCYFKILSTDCQLQSCPWKK